MIYNTKLDNFDKFITEWNLDIEYVLFGASKECVQFIRSIDYLLGSDKLKIKYIVDHNIKDTTIINNINEISSFFRQSKNIKTNRTDLKLIHIDDFVASPNEKVIITTDVYRKLYKMYLDEHDVWFHESNYLLFHLVL